MEAKVVWACAICGDEKAALDHWFLVAESRWQDRLKILHWDDQLAVQAGILHVCSPAHVQEIVVHWMATGGLDYPFARVPARPRRRALRREILESDHPEVNTEGVRQIGEISVDRENIGRVLSENPYSLSVILDALLGALQRDPARTESAMELEGVLRPLPQEV